MPLDADRLLDLYHQMLLIRRFDELALELRLAGRIHGVVHPYIGEEAIAVGICANLRPTDRITSTHRGHGHCIAKGADVRRMMAELFGRRDGYCKGKGGSMHIADFDVGMLGANGIVGAGFPIAAGAALAAQLGGTDDVAACFFGDGATGAGAFHESFNISAIWKLPIIWVCENNGYAVETPITAGLARTDVATFAQSYGFPGVSVDGNDLLAVYEAARSAVERARAGQGPSLIECKTYRRSAHAVRDALPAEKRSAEERADWEARDPIAAVERILAERGLLETAAPAARERVERQLAEAVAFAEASPYPAPEEALDDVFAPARSA